LLAQAIDLSKDPRKPTQQELEIWDQFLDKYHDLTSNVLAFVSTANVAATFQDWSNKNGVPVVTFDHIDQAAVDSILNRYNIIGRLIDRCVMQMYLTHFSRGDVSIYAPESMDVEQYMQDIYPHTREESLKGILVLAIVAGVALLIGGIATLSIVDWDTGVRDKRFRDRLLKADLEMMKKPKALRDEWQQMKRKNAELIRKSNEQHKTESPWLQKLFSSGGIDAKTLAAVGLIITLLMVGWSFTRKKN
jgi:hypothetical protein